MHDSSQTSQRFSQSISPSLGDRGEAILGEKAVSPFSLPSSPFSPETPHTQANKDSSLNRLVESKVVWNITQVILNN